MTQIFDVAIVGGGVNGCGIARDAAGRGHSVYLCEMNDLASGTSSWSSKLVHGGLRYLEYYEFRLVREALMEREVLWKLAPHIIRPMRFVLPHHAGLRPAWLLRLGLFLYDYIGGRKLLPPTATLDLANAEVGKPLQPQRYAKGFEYSDCFVDDARLVALNALDAAERGAVIETRSRAVAITQEKGVWRLTVEDTASGQQKMIYARTIVNAGGPWVERVLGLTSGVRAKAHVRLVQGSHIVVPRLYSHDRAYILQNSDGRIVFVIPYQDNYTLIGTTDRDYDGDPSQVRITDEEIEYLCASVSEYFATPVRPRDVVWTYAGVRPLYDDGASEAKAATRDYVFETDEVNGLPLLSIYGGKITTYRRLAEEAIAKLGSHLDAAAKRGKWTATEVLPGGDFAADAIDQEIVHLMRDYPFVPAPQARRFIRSYGTRARVMLAGATTAEDMGEEFGAGLTAREARYLITHEWARTADDILWRRSKLGLRMSAQQISVLEAWVATESGAVLDASRASVERVQSTE